LLSLGFLWIPLDMLTFPLFALWLLNGLKRRFMLLRLLFGSRNWANASTTVGLYLSGVTFGRFDAVRLFLILELRASLKLDGLCLWVFICLNMIFSWAYELS
jgi:hypothetical protein